MRALHLQGMSTLLETYVCSMMSVSFACCSTFFFHVRNHDLRFPIDQRSLHSSNFGVHHNTGTLSGV